MTSRSKLNILLPALGSAGDVHPFISLGRALMQRGHSATLISNEYFEPMIRRAGLQFIRLGTIEEYRFAIENLDPFYTRRAFKTLAEGGILRYMRPLYEILSAYDPSDIVVVASSLSIGARIGREKLSFPLATVHLSPIAFRSVHDTPTMEAGRPIPRWVPKIARKLLYWAIDMVIVDRICCPAINAFRSELGLPQVRRVFANWMHSPDQVIGLFPEWFAAKQPDWPSQARLTGFLFYDGAGVEGVSTEVTEFLHSGAPPVVFTPGTPFVHAGRFFELAIEACQLLDSRGILLTRHKSAIPSSLPERIRHFDYVPFSMILNQSRAFVHHGGIGTITQGLAAGVPQLAMPMIMDQPDNAVRLERLGVGTYLVPGKFPALALADKLDYLIGSSEVAAQCAKYSEKLASTTAVDLTCSLIEKLAHRT